MARYTRLCPSCGAEIDRKTVPVLKAHSFSCPFCGAPPRVTTDHVGVALVISPILSAALMLLLGFPWAYFRAHHHHRVRIDFSRIGLHRRSCSASQTRTTAAD
jgi:hypothetical protein